ncbi:MAG: hypothetical protein JOZ51_27135 [Chloroflexi bacterium]|nr:hypothetical protein [Chloroflexota bacterium]
MSIPLISLIFSIVSLWSTARGGPARVVHRPQIIVIAGEATTAKIRVALANLGFRIVVEHSLLAGYELARRLLAVSRPERPSVVLIDLALTEPGFPELTAPLLIAVLTRQMQRGTLHHAWHVGGMSAQQPTLKAEAIALGCQATVGLPLNDVGVAAIQQIIDQPGPPSHPQPAPDTPDLSEICQNIAQRVLDSVKAAQIRTWTPEDAALVLSWLTTYPAPPIETRGRRSTDRDLSRIKLLLRSFGNQHIARQQLEQIATYWQQRYPLHGEVLQKFLDGWERREIVSYFVGQGLYEDSRVYHCIKELPQRLSDHLQRHQIGIGPEE